MDATDLHDDRACLRAAAGRDDGDVVVVVCLRRQFLELILLARLKQVLCPALVVPAILPKMSYFQT